MNTNHDNSPITELRVTIERGDRRCTLTGAELDRLFDGPVSIKLTAALFSQAWASSSGRKGTIGDGGAVKQDVTGTNGNVSEKLLNNRSVHRGEGGVGSRGEEDGEVSTGDTERLASYLADRLADPKSLAFYRRVAVLVPREVVREALVAALDLAPAEVRKSRAAYFTAIVRPHLRPRVPRTPPLNLPYAPHTPTS